MSRIGRRAAARDENEKPIVDALQRLGATVVRLDEPVDLLVGYRGVTYLLEVKRPAGPQGGVKGRTLTPEQARFMARWMGGRVAIVRDVQEALRVIGMLGPVAGTNCRGK